MAEYSVLVLRCGNHYFRRFSASGIRTALCLVEDPDDASMFKDTKAIDSYVEHLDPDRRRSFLQADMTPIVVHYPIPAEFLEG